MNILRSGTPRVLLRCYRARRLTQYEGIGAPGSVSVTRPLSTLKRSSEGRAPDVKETPNSIAPANLSFLPEAWHPYAELARVDKQAGTLLLLLPCTWGVALATPAGQLPDFVLLSQLSLGAFIMRGAGCTINDLWDKDFDKHVERTKSRPLARGAVSVSQAVTFLSGQLGAGALLLYSLPNLYEVAVLSLSSIPLVVAYPLMKRYTNFPQFVLGLTFNWGALVGYTAVAGTISSSLTYALPAYCGGVCWTLVYDTVYGYQDVEDDKKLGLKSVPLYLGEKPQLALTVTGAAMLGCLGYAGAVNELGSAYYCGLTGVGGHLLWQIWTADLKNPANLFQRFDSNKYLGLGVFASIVAGKVL